jgi:hypothetical protein
MLARAIAAFIALPGIVAFAIPIAIGSSAGRPVQHVAVAVVILSLGTVLLLCASSTLPGVGRWRRGLPPGTW